MWWVEPRNVSRPVPRSAFGFGELQYAVKPTFGYGGAALLTTSESEDIQQSLAFKPSDIAFSTHGFLAAFT